MSDVIKNQIQRLNDAANIEINDLVSLKIWFRKSAQSLKMGVQYEIEDNLERAYIYYQRYVRMIFIELPKHSKYKQPEVALDKKVHLKKAKEVLERCEVLKKKLILKYERELEEAKLEEVRLQQQRIREEQEKKKQDEIHLQNFLQQREQELQRQKQYEHDIASINQKAPLHTTQYPAFNSQTDVGPPRPSSSSKPSQAPDRPPAYTKPIPNRPESHPVPVIPAVPTSSLSNAGQKFSELRSVNIPITTVEQFLYLASSNTHRNLETCGILVGTLSNDVFRVTEILIPKQSATSDSCTTKNEEDVFMYQDKKNLISLGWIHTHPTQTCFMSSLDLHTHYGYQIMLPEAVAIVCAPSKNDNKEFHLSKSGLKVIGNCRERGFHPHPPGPPIYVTGLSHVNFVKEPLKIVDLR